MEKPSLMMERAMNLALGAGTADNIETALVTPSRLAGSCGRETRSQHMKSRETSRPATTVAPIYCFSLILQDDVVAVRM